jgi:hypothetical protein
MAEDQEIQNQQATAPAGDKQDAAELNISDLNAMKLIIDVASSRGAFKPNEMVLVGQTYSKLTTFLESVSKQSQQQTPTGV